MNPDSSEVVFQCAELVLHIFSFVSTKELCELSKVCKLFRELSKEPMLWTSISLTAKHVKTNPDLNHLKYLQKLNLNNLDKECFANLSLSTKQLKTLMLRDCSGTGKILDHFLSNFKNVEQLKVSMLDIEPSHSYSITDVNELFITQEYVSEQVISIVGFNQLKKLHLHCVEFQLDVCANLKELVIDHCAILHYQNFVQSIEKCRELEVLKLWYINPGYTFMKSIEDLLYWKSRLPKLRVLLTHLYDIRYRDMLKLLQEWKSIQEIGFLYEGLIVRQLQKHFPAVKFLTCSFPQPFAIGMEVRQFSNVQSLYRSAVNSVHI